jgi:aminomethyltransferase
MVHYKASFEERFGIEIPSVITDYESEYDNIRNSVGISDFSFMQMYTIPEDTGLDFLDDLFSGNVAKVRFGRILHTMLADDDGFIMADCYIANNDEEFILLCESIKDDAEINDFLEKKGSREAGLENVCDSHVIISIDGYKAWNVVKKLFGMDVLSLPYLSIEMYKFINKDIRLFRAGKTSEFGYLLMAPVDSAYELFDTVLEYAKADGGGLCGLSVHNSLRLEGRFFNIFAEGFKVRDPLTLGLQWMIDFEKDMFSGRDAINKRRDSGLTHKVIGIRSDTGSQVFKPQADIFLGDRKAGHIISTCFSPLLKCMLGLALFPVDIAYSGLTFNLDSPDGQKVHTISMPPIMPKSLTVKIDEM